MGKKDLFAVWYHKYGLSLYISQEKGDHYLFSHYNLILRKLKEKMS